MLVSSDFMGNEHSNCYRDVHQESTHEGESKKCDKQCYVCKHYLVEASETDSYHTNNYEIDLLYHTKH